MSQAVLVTGGASGIGRAVVREAARRGASVLVVDVDADGAERARAEALALGAPRAGAVRADVGAEGEVAAAIEQGVTEVGPLNGAVAAAGIERNETVAALPASTWRRVVEVNLTGTFLTTQAVARHFRASGTAGAVVCLSSPSAFVGFAGGGNAAYGASKGGVSAFVRAAAIDLADDGIRVNAVIPGATDTPLLTAGLSGEALRSERASVEARAREQIPMRRLGRPEEVAAACLWLLSAEASYVTGSHLVCDGGLMARGANDF